VYDQVTRVVMHGPDATLDGKQIQACINSNDQRLAKTLVDKYNLEVL
jgi:hypothetical protein